MIRNRSCALSTIHFVVAGSFSFLLTAESAALELSIIESGPDSDPAVGLWVRGMSTGFSGVNRLVSPSGGAFTPDSILEDKTVSDLLLRFDSVGTRWTTSKANGKRRRCFASPRPGLPRHV